MVEGKYPEGDVSRLHVLRLCSVFEPEPDPRAGADGLDRAATAYDPVGGMQNHTASLTRSLDAVGVRQTVVTSRLAAPTGTSPVGQGARVHRVGLRTTRLRQLWAACALPRVLGLRGRRRPDVVHAHQGEDVAVLLLGMLAARVHGCPLVVTLHCSVRHTLTGRSWRTRWLRVVGGAVERAALRRASAVLVLVPRTAAAVRRDGIDPDRVHVLPSGFEPALFERDHPDLLADVPRPRVGYVGRWCEQKRPDLLVEAFGGVATPASLVLVGDGPLRPQVEDAVRRSPARSRIHSRGFVPHTEVPAVLAGLDLLVLPSTYEEMGSVLVEAMASGLPVVASRVGGIPDVVRDAETGVLVPPLDVAALTAAVEEVLADPAMRAKLGEEARRVSADYAWPALGRRVHDVYRSVLADPVVR
jgi:glycogen synthase